MFKLLVRIFITEIYLFVKATQCNFSCHHSRGRHMNTMAAPTLQVCPLQQHLTLCQIVLLVRPQKLKMSTFLLVSLIHTLTITLLGTPV